ncbi:MAG: BMP family ABC transporter substrate-binding protein, partial [Rhizobiales bacterium]|nr:BMP family ABC transporter substrate-binding protein [Hyphomicrobiales bacterium]
KAVLDGTWKSQQSWEGLKEKMLIMAPYLNMPDDVAAMAKDTEAKITADPLLPFRGKVLKQDGSDAGPIDDGVLLGMNWYVKGIDDKFPQ